MTNPAERVVSDIVKTLVLAAGPDRVWRALTDPDELVQWFPDEGADVDLKPGGEGAWVWANHGRYAVRFEVVEPNRRLVWSWAREADTAFEDGMVTTVEFRLEPAGDGGTTLYLRESGFVNEEDRQGNDGGWDKELGELVTFLEIGTDVPNANGPIKEEA